jgi:hypothetical protein
MTVLPNGNWGILMENGNSSYFDKITFISDSLGGLTGGADALDPDANPPVLNITSSTTNLVVSWPTNAVGYSLEQNFSLVSNDWTSVVGVGPPEVTNGQIRLRVVSTNASTFFRLRSP